MPMQTMLMRLARVLAPVVTTTAIGAIVSTARRVASSPVRQAQTEPAHRDGDRLEARAEHRANFLRTQRGHYDGGTFIGPSRWTIGQSGEDRIIQAA
jgi:hypothetical protein